MKISKKNVYLLLILILLIAFTVVFSLFTNSQDNKKSEKKAKTTVSTSKAVEETTVIEETDVTTEENPSEIEVDEHQHQHTMEIKKVADDVKKTVKDFNEIEDKVREVINSYYPETESVEYVDFAKDDEKYSYTFKLKGEVDRTVIIYYWLNDKSLSYQHY